MILLLTLANSGDYNMQMKSEAFQLGSNLPKSEGNLFRKIHSISPKEDDLMMKLQPHAWVQTV